MFVVFFGWFVYVLGLLGGVFVITHVVCAFAYLCLVCLFGSLYDCLCLCTFVCLVGCCFVCSCVRLLVVLM